MPDLESLLHKPAFLTLGPAGNGIHGLVRSAGQGDSGKRLTRYRITLVPQLAYLAQRTNQRIFQHLTVPQIVALILEEHGILADAYRFQLGTRYPEREYCVQYDESDLQFVQRLCCEEGIHFHFQHSATAHLLVFGDDQTVFPRLAPVAYQQDSGLVADRPAVKRFGVRLETRTSRVTRRDYDFEKPRLTLESAARGEARPDLEDYDYPGRFVDRERGKHLARRALERQRSDYRLAEGRSDQSLLLSGHFLPLAAHPQAGWNDLWLLTEVIHEGRQPQVLEKASSPTPRRARTTSGRVTATASRPRPGRRSSGPADTAEAAHPRHAERGGDRSEGRGNPLRPLRSGEGAIPLGSRGPGRRQQQLLVTRCRLGGKELRRHRHPAGRHGGAGDLPRRRPDQPLVTGCLFHREHPVPYELPAHKTRSVFKSLSSPGGGGYNELRIEDRKGQEQIFVHAQRDWDENIEHDQKIRVGHQRHDTVEANSYSEFKAEEHRTTHAERKVEVRASDHLTVANDQHLKIASGQFVEAGQEIHLSSGLKVVLEAGAELTLKGGGSFLKLDASGVTLSGANVRVNSGGSPGSGSGAAPLLPGRCGRPIATRPAPC